MTMGSWDYFTVKMTMQQVADNVRFAAEVHDDPTLAMTIQRQLDESRVKKDIVKYLEDQPDRFFSSIVVAALGGNPKFYPITVENTPQLELFAEDELLNSTFGVLKFDGTQDYYALDGQHRLSAIKVLIDPTTPFSPPDGFAQEHLTVMVVVPNSEEGKTDFLVRYRRLFGNLNRYAKPMDQVTNIAMDEDDAFAISTRRLITEFEFFRAAGRQWGSHRIKTKKGKTMKSGESQFTSLETLYQLNIELLKTNPRQHEGWAQSATALKAYQRLRPSEEDLDALFDELTRIWTGILEAIPELVSDPAVSRNHEAENDPDATDSFLFWPISQEILAKSVRDHLNRAGVDTAQDGVTVAEIASVLAPYADVDWRLHSYPWRGLLLVRNEKNAWVMRSEDRAKVSNFCAQLLGAMVGTVELQASDLEYSDGETSYASKYRAFYAPCDDGVTWRDGWAEVCKLLSE